MHHKTVMWLKTSENTAVSCCLKCLSFSSNLSPKLLKGESRPSSRMVSYKLSTFMDLLLISYVKKFHNRQLSWQHHQYGRMWLVKKSFNFVRNKTHQTQTFKNSKLWLIHFVSVSRHVLNKSWKYCNKIYNCSRATVNSVVGSLSDAPFSTNVNCLSY